MNEAEVEGLTRTRLRELCSKVAEVALEDENRGKRIDENSTT